MTIWIVLGLLVLALSLFGWRWNQLETENLRRRSTRMVKGIRHRRRLFRS